MDYFSPPPAPPLIPLWMTKSQRMREKEREKKRWGSSAADIIDLNLVNLLTDSVVFPQWLYHNNFTRARSPFFSFFHFLIHTLIFSPHHCICLWVKSIFSTLISATYLSLSTPFLSLLPLPLLSLYTQLLAHSWLHPDLRTFLLLLFLVQSLKTAVLSVQFMIHFIKKNIFFLIQLALTDISSLFSPLLFMYYYFFILSCFISWLTWSSDWIIIKHILINFKWWTPLRFEIV